VIAHALSRLTAVLMMNTLSYVKPDGKAKPLATSMSRSDVAVACLFGLLPLILLWCYFADSIAIWTLLLHIAAPTILAAVVAG